MKKLNFGLKIILRYQIIILSVIACTEIDPDVVFVSYNSERTNHFI